MYQRSKWQKVERSREAMQARTTAVNLPRGVVATETAAIILYIVYYGVWGR